MKLSTAIAIGASVALLYGIAFDRTFFPLTFSHRKGVAQVARTGASTFTFMLKSAPSTDYIGSAGPVGDLLGPVFPFPARRGAMQEPVDAEIYFNYAASGTYGSIAHPLLAFAYRFVLRGLFCCAVLVAWWRWAGKKTPSR